MKNPYKKSWQNEMETMKAIGWDEGYQARLEDTQLRFYEKIGFNVSSTITVLPRLVAGDNGIYSLV